MIYVLYFILFFNMLSSFLFYRLRTLNIKLGLVAYCLTCFNNSMLCFFRERGKRKCSKVNGAIELIVHVLHLLP